LADFSTDFKISTLDMTMTALSTDAITCCVQVRCPENAVYVYDGLPAYVGRYAGGSRLLGSLCTEDLAEDGDLRLEASSGIMTVHYSEVCV
jgi:hypothetical protein